MKSNAVGRQVDCDIWSVKQIAESYPKMNVGDLKGGLWVPGDGFADPVEICKALIHLAADMGVHVVPQCEIIRVRAEDGAVSAVETDKGFVECRAFINAAGTQARYVGTLSNPRVQIPLHAAEHYIIHCEPDARDRDQLFDLPVVRDPDAGIYVRESGGLILCGGFETVSKPAFEKEGATVRGVSMPDWDHCYEQLENLVARIPCLDDAFYEKLTNDPEPYSPDAEWILGQVPEIRNYYVAAAMRSSGVGAAGGVGEVMADFVQHGKTKFDMLNLDIQRFLPLHNNRKFLRDRVREVRTKNIKKNVNTLK